MTMEEFSGEDVSQAESFLCRSQWVLKNYDWDPLAIISTLFTILKTEGIANFKNNVRTIESNYDLNLMLDLDVGSILDNV